jgi:predicted TIM-barrel fold metal-dependent hydrolase
MLQCRKPSAIGERFVNVNELVAIDVHTHAEEPCGSHPDDGYDELQAAMAVYFNQPNHRPTIEETAAYYRARKIGAVIFPVDAEREMGFRRYSNEEVAEKAAANSDILIPFASIDPAKGKAGAREARRLIRDFGIRGFKFHPSQQGFFPNDRSAYVLYEAIAEAKLPALFHTGQTGVGSGMRGGAGIRLKYSNPMFIDDVAVDFPDMPIILAHPSFPWQEEALSVAQHKPNVYIDLSGWSPKYFPPILVRYANSLLKHKVLFGSDWPLIQPDRWLRDFETLDIKPEVRPLILKDNAVKLLGLARPKPDVTLFPRGAGYNRATGGT